MKVFVVVILVALNIVVAQKKLETKYTWNQVEWEFPSKEVKEQFIASGDYAPERALPVGIERWRNKLFVSVPRWKKGVPATLNYIDLDETSTTPQHNVLLKPYRGFEANKAGDCENGLSTVYRIKADKCDRLWVLDVGTTGIGDETEQVCPYTVNVFDLKTDKLIHRYAFRKEDTNKNSFIANTLVDVGDNCDDAHAYFSDELGYGLVVYSLKQNESWRFEHPYFFPDPLKGDFNIGGLNFQWSEEGIFGITLGQRQADGSKMLYFSPLASHREFAVPTKVLNDKSRVENSFKEFIALEERDGDGHTTSRVIDEKTGIMLYNLIDQNAIGCWNTKVPYKDSNLDIVDQDNHTLIFPSDVKIDADDNVWVISDKMPNFLIKSVDPKEINYRIFTAPMSVLMEGTKCGGGHKDVGERFADNSEAQKPSLTDILSPVAASVESVNKPTETGDKPHSWSGGYGGYHGGYGGSSGGHGPHWDHDHHHHHDWHRDHVQGGDGQRKWEQRY